MNRLEHRRRHRLRQRILLAFLAVAALGGGLALGLFQDRQAAAPGPEPSGTETSEAVAMRTTLLSVASTADTSRVLAIPPLLIAEPVDGGPGRGLLLDPAMRAVGPAGEAPLRQHASGFGPEGLAGAVRNELGLQIDVTAEITEVQLATILEGAGPLEVTVTAPIEEGTERVYEAGIHRMEPAELVTFLAFPFGHGGLDAATRLGILADAWETIALAPDTAAAVRGEPLATDAAEALTALTTVQEVTAVPVTALEDGIVLDRLVYASVVEEWRSVWLGGIAPEDRPVVDLFGQTLVEPLLLLIADGIRVARITEEPVGALRIETDDGELGRRLADLLADGEIVEPDEPLRPGSDARIRFPRAA